ncbi:hypothetical protein OIV83_005178 [Microbotryomycetes sp. JL201]|nr:hypothetical protein OIV83_005178 [Microbotryomycetes sp. JL201]
MRARRRLGATIAACTCLLPGTVRSQTPGVVQPNVTLSQIQHIFAFGDSYTATGYDPTKGLLNIPLIGGTSSGGLNWLQFIATGNPATQASFFSFAQFGANTNASVISIEDSTVPDLVDQVRQWQQFFVPPPAAVPWTSQNSLFAVWAGINDIGNALVNNQSFPDALPALSRSYAGQVDALYRAGARNFLFLTVPAIEKSPLISGWGNDAVEIVSNNIGIFNDALTEYCNGLQTVYPDAFYVLIDSRPVFDAILASPLQYGFTDTTDACPLYDFIDNDPNLYLPLCPWPLPQYFWRNDYHPTWRVHQLLATVVKDLMSPQLATNSPTLVPTTAPALSTTFTIARPTSTIPSSLLTSRATNAASIVAGRPIGTGSTAVVSTMSDSAIGSATEQDSTSLSRVATGSNTQPTATPTSQSSSLLESLSGLKIGVACTIALVLYWSS